MDYYVSKKVNPGPVISFSYKNADLENKAAPKKNKATKKTTAYKEHARFLGSVLDFDPDVRSALVESNLHNCSTSPRRLMGDDKASRHLVRQRRDNGRGWRRRVKRRTDEWPRGVRMSRACAPFGP